MHNPRILKHVTVILICIVISSCSDEAKLLPLTANATVLAFGDSLTYGTGTSRDKTYPAVLESLIQRKVVNAGLPGETTKKGLPRLVNLIDRHHPELIILCHGGNDILGKLDLQKTRDNIQLMIDLARKSNSQVVLIGVPEFGLFLDSSPMYKALADKNNIPVENTVIGDILRNNSLKSDYIHPNSKGYQLLAEKIASLLREAGGVTNKQADF